MVIAKPIPDGIIAFPTSTAKYCSVEDGALGFITIALKGGWDFSAIYVQNLFLVAGIALALLLQIEEIYEQTINHLRRQ